MIPISETLCTSRVAVRAGPITALGPAVNLAARIVGVAEGGMILVGPETARRIEGVFATRELGKKQLKNVKDDIIIYQVTGNAL